MSAATTLRLACIDAEAPPLFSRWSADRGRPGFEPAVAQLIADELGRALDWVCMPWMDMLPAVRAHRVDAVLCGQGITPARQREVDFTRPYAIFHESVLCRRGSGILRADQLSGLRVGAIDGSTNMSLAESFERAVTVAFGGTEDVFADMLAALAAGKVDAIVDDDVVCVPLGLDPRFEVAFTVATGNRWSVGVAKDRPDGLLELDQALARVMADGRHRDVWNRWLPGLDYPFTDGLAQ